MLELLSPAGSPEAAIAAVQNGANAVYMGFGDFNARRRAKNFTEEEFSEAVKYCRVRGVKVYLTLNTLLTDRELESAAEVVRRADQMGVDAILVQDIGVLRMARQAAPQLPLHASTQMTIHNIEGVRAAAALGISRVVLSRELSKDQIALICSQSPIETEVFVHGAHCMSYSGQCTMSALIGGRSGNRGECAQPCRMAYGWKNWTDAYPLSLKDMCLAGHLRELSDIGVTCVKIEGRMKRPEYVATVTDIYARAIKENREPTEKELERLKAAFSRQGFTDGYYANQKGPAMFGVRMEEESDCAEWINEARAGYSNKEAGLVPVCFYSMLRAGEPAQVAAKDEAGHVCIAVGAVPEAAVRKEITATDIENQLSKTGGTPYVCTGVKAYVESGITLPVSSVNALRREALAKLTEERSQPPRREQGEYHPGVRYFNREDKPVLTASLLRAEQLTDDLIALGLSHVYLPLSEVVKHPAVVSPLVGNQTTTLAIALPRILGDYEIEETSRQLEAAYSMGIREALVGNLGQISLARSFGFKLRGEFGLNVANSQTLKELRHMGFLSATVSFELKLAQIRDISKSIDIEMIVYGRLPLMVTENCIIKSRSGHCGCDNLNQLTDKTGAQFPVLRESGCRNVIYNSRKLFLADKSSDYEKIGLWGAQLYFTTENPQECVRVVKRYLNQGEFTPNLFTRGLYYRGVE